MRPLAEGGEHGGEVPAGGTADGADAARIEAEIEGVVPHPGDTRLHVVDRGGERIERCEPVVHGERDEALLGQRAGERRGLLLVAEDPAAAVDHHHARPDAAAGGDVGVELQVVATDVAVREVVPDVDVEALARCRGCGPVGAGDDGCGRQDREHGDDDGDRRSSHRSFRVSACWTVQPYPPRPDTVVRCARG